MERNLGKRTKGPLEVLLLGDSHSKVRFLSFHVSGTAIALQSYSGFVEACLRQAGLRGRLSWRFLPAELTLPARHML